MTIHLDYESSQEIDFDYRQLLTKVVEATMDYVECPYEVEVNILFSGNEEIQKVNQEFRGMDRPTDVLSFPMIDFQFPGDFSVVEEAEGFFFHPETGELTLGDIMISMDKVKEQAMEYGHTQERELAFLTVHSLLHLCGYDHIDHEERMLMEEMQKFVLNKLEIVR